MTEPRARTQQQKSSRYIVLSVEEKEQAKPKSLIFPDSDIIPRLKEKRF